LGKYVWYKPIRNENSLNLVFYIPRKGEKDDEYKDYINLMSYYISGRDKNSLFESIRLKGWCTTIYVRTIRKSNEFDMMYYTFKISESGLQNI
jgi:secreted Zn-dependent insulinase-like peptidase